MCVTWTATEYYFHGIVYHREESLDLNAEGPGGQKLVDMFLRHLHHHVFMNEKYRVVQGLDRYALYLPIIMAVLLLLLPVPTAVMLHAGWLTGTLVYDGMHYSYHHGPDIKVSLSYALKWGNLFLVCRSRSASLCVPVQLGWYQRMKASHMRHHFRDNQVEFGVTAPW